MRIRAGHLVTALLLFGCMAPVASALVASDFSGSVANNCETLPCTNAGEQIFTLPAVPVDMWKTPDGNYLFVGQNGDVNLYSLSSVGWQVVWELPGDMHGQVSSAAYDSGHELLAVGNTTGVSIIDVGPDREVMQFVNTSSAVVDVAWDPDGVDEDGDTIIDLPYLWMAMDDNDRAVQYNLKFQYPTNRQTFEHAGDIGAVHVMTDGTIITGGDDEIFISSPSGSTLVIRDHVLTPGFSALFDILMLNSDESVLYAASNGGQKVISYDTDDWITTTVPANGENPLNLGFIQMSTMLLTTDSSLLLGATNQLFFVSIAGMEFDDSNKLDYPNGVDALIETVYGGLILVSSKKVHLLDFDQDNDGVSDTKDDFPFDNSQTTDTDGDGCGDNTDGNNPDYFPEDEYECIDTDEDGVGDNGDDFPNDPTEQVDTDDDGVGDNADAFPEEFTQQTDFDMDGYGDNMDGQQPDDCPDEFGESSVDRYGCIDTDRDGYSNPIDGEDNSNADAFPTDSSQWKDTDEDGFGDNPDGTAGDACPFDYGESNKTLEYHQDASLWLTPSHFGCKDLDKDGFADSTDQFDNNPAEWLDADNDGIGSNADYNDYDSTYTTIEGKCQLQLPVDRTEDCRILLDEQDTIKTEEELKQEQLQADIQFALVYGGISFVGLVVAILLVGQLLKMMGAGRTKAQRAAAEAGGNEEVMADVEGTEFQYDSSLDDQSAWGDDDQAGELELDMSAIPDDAFEDAVKVDPVTTEEDIATSTSDEAEEDQTSPSTSSVEQPEAKAPPADVPPVPESGLPEGWTMDQWKWYGAEWLEKNG